MVATLPAATKAPLKLEARYAADIMNPDPKSIRAEATLAEILNFFTSRNLAAAPVVNHAGRPIGVVSRSDVLIHQAQGDSPPRTEYFEIPDLERSKDPDATACARVTARDLMTPAVFAVGPKTPINKVVADMVGLHVHRLFVVDDDGLLVGVISAMDIVKNLQ